MKTYTILGNCQATVIAQYLNSTINFSEEYNYIFFPPVHTIDKDRDIDLLNVFREIDLLIYQPVLDNSRFGNFTSNAIKSIMKDSSINICIPSMYYDGYFPTIGSVEGIDGTLRGVHDFVIVAAFLEGRDEKEVVSLLSQNFILAKDTILQFHQNSIKSLRERETKYNVDIKISSFINENYQKIKLFHTFNHPTVKLVKYVCEQILNKLDIIDNCRETGDFFDFIQAPIYYEVYKTLGLEFENFSMSRENKEIDIEFLVNNDFKIYKASNKAILKDKLITKKRFLLKYFNNIEL